MILSTDFGRLMQSPEDFDFERLLSSANPTDSNLYLGKGLVEVTFVPFTSPLE